MTTVTDCLGLRGTILDLFNYFFGNTVKMGLEWHIEKPAPEELLLGGGELYTGGPGLYDGES